MTDADSVRSLDRVTAGWLTARLRAAGHTDAEVIGFRHQPVGTGQMGNSVRFTLEYSRTGPDLPSTIVGKFPSEDPLSRMTGAATGNYAREVGFYLHLQPRLTIPTPDCYHAAIDQSTQDFVILLEDMAPAEQGDQLSGCDLDTARIAVGNLVGLHRPTWCDSSLKELDWLMSGNPFETQALVRTFYQSLLGGFMDLCGRELSPSQRALYESVAEASKFPIAPPPGEVFSVVHLDYRLDNLLIDDRQTPPRVAAVDWQTVSVGHPLTDVSYFLGASLLPEHRRIVEDGMVRAYHEALCDSGVEDLDWPQCWEAYRRGSFHGLGIAVLASMMVQRTERGDQLMATMADRHSAHALDLGASEFLD